MTTPLNDNAGYVSVLGAGLTVTAPQADSNTCCSKDQAFVIKVQHGEDIRRLTVPELSWDALIKRIAEAFKLPEAKIALKYKDEEGDLVTIQSTEELLDAHSLSLQQRSLLRLYAFVGKRKQVPHPTAAPSAASTAALPLQLADPFAELKCPDLDLKAQKKALKEEKKALKEERKALYRQRKEEHKDKKKLAKAELKSNIEGLREQVQAPFDPTKGSWREQRRSLCEQLRKEKEELKRCKREMKIEQRIAHREARRQARTEGGEGRNRIIARFVKHVTIPDGTHLEPGQKFVKTWRMRNEGEQAWTDCKIVFVSKRNGDQMGAPETVVIPTPVSPQSEVDVSVEMVAPDQPGRYVGFWRLVSADGRKFGQRVWVKIDVVCSSSSSDDDKEKEKEPIPSTSFDNLEAEVEQSFFDIKEEKDAFIEPKQGRDLEAASSISAPVKPTIAALLKQLKDLGFSEDVGRNIMLLKKHDGDLDKVIAELLA